MANEQEKKYCGLTLKVAPLILFSDDTGGNTSKRWNKFDSFLMIPAAMDFDDRNELENLHFIATSHDIKPTEMLDVLTNDLAMPETGLRMYDAVEDEEIILLAPLLMIGGDDPRLSEMACHASM